MTQNQIQQMHLRLPPALHNRLREIADEQCVSLNQAAVLLIASATAGFDFGHKEEGDAAVTARPQTTPDAPDDARTD